MSSVPLWFLVVVALLIGPGVSRATKSCEMNGRGECKVDSIHEAIATPILQPSRALQPKAKEGLVPAIADPACTLYMAESTIPNAGLGIFTAVDRGVNETLGNGDVLIPIVDLWYHLNVLNTEALKNQSYLLDPTKDYVWFGPEMGMHPETAHPYASTEYVTAFAPGLDAAINCHLGLDNVDKTLPLYETANLHRSKDPGVGAFTPYHKCLTVTTKTIPAGGELFKYYGDSWFTTRPVFDELPLSTDYPVAEAMTQSFYRMIFQNGRIPGQVVDDAWQFIRTLPFGGRMLNALPTELEGVEVVGMNNIRAYIQPNYIRSLEFLQQHGRCLENIRPATSTIPQAGRGAFAIRFLGEGTAVGGTPLMLVPNNEFFQMYDGSWYTKHDTPNVNKIVTYQILLNYCWHHDESSIFLCPYGAGVNYINHSSKQANVKLRWAEDGEMCHRGDLLVKSPWHFHQQASPGLFFDYVATRDIQAGEEILIDYGDAWEEAWQDHVSFWQEEVSYPSDYQSSRDWNVQNWNVTLRTELEQEQDPYPSYFEMRCLIDYDPDTETEEKIRARWTIDEPGSPCKIIDREEDDGEVLYHVFYSEGHAEIGSHNPDAAEWYELGWIHRAGIKFLDQPYSTDMYLPTAFRHHLVLPDYMMPDAWRGEYIVFQ